MLTTEEQLEAKKATYFGYALGGANNALAPDTLVAVMRGLQLKWVANSPIPDMDVGKSVERLLMRAADDVGCWLGYLDVEEYAERMRRAPAEVRGRLEAAVVSPPVRRDPTYVLPEELDRTIWPLLDRLYAETQSLRDTLRILQETVEAWEKDEERIVDRLEETLQAFGLGPRPGG